MKVAIFFLCITASVFSLKLFLIGGAVNENSTLVFTPLSNVIPSRPPQPNKCDQNWQTTKCPRIAVATSAAASQADGNDAYSNDTVSVSYRTLFLKYGLSPKHLSVHRDNFKVHADVNTPQGKANSDIIKQADIIFYNGGDQIKHTRAWLKDDETASSLLQVVKDRLLRDDIVVAGTSAGSMVWSNQTFGEGNAFGLLYFRNTVGLAQKKTADGQVGGSGLLDNRNGTKSLQYSYNGGKVPAFGILNFTVDTHFNARGRLGRLVPALVDLRQKFGIGIDQNTSIYYNNGVGTVYGWNGVTFCDIQKALVYPLAYFTINNVTGHYLTDGDQFDFKTRTVTSSKKLIITPAYNGPTDSNDILAAYQATLLETRVVDQKSLYNLGKTKKPSDFSDKTTPIFQIKFSKSSQTRGYYNNKKYTVSNVVYDFSYGSTIEQHLHHKVLPSQLHPFQKAI